MRGYSFKFLRLDNAGGVDSLVSYKRFSGYLFVYYFSDTKLVMSVVYNHCQTITYELNNRSSTVV